LKQVVENIPAYLVAKIAKKYGIGKQSRTFSPWSHAVSMLFAHPDTRTKSQYRIKNRIHAVFATKTREPGTAKQQRTTWQKFVLPN